MNNSRTIHHGIPLHQRFEMQVEKTDTCWNWTGYRRGLPTSWKPVIVIEGKAKLVANYVYSTFLGSIPDGLSVRQRCGNIVCVRPEHLFLTKIRGKFTDEQILERFNSGFSKTDGCWLWTGRTIGLGRHKKPWLVCSTYKIIAYRYSYATFVGHIPEGYSVCHKCDNPMCVRPDHLFVGTQRENMQDMVRKGRQSRVVGEKNPVSKLTDNDVREIRKSYVGHCRINGANALAKKFNVSPSLIEGVVRRRFWAHVN